MSTIPPPWVVCWIQLQCLKWSLTPPSTHKPCRSLQKCKGSNQLQSNLLSPIRANLSPSMIFRAVLSRQSAIPKFWLLHTIATIANSILGPLDPPRKWLDHFFYHRSYYLIHFLTLPTNNLHHLHTYTFTHRPLPNILQWGSTTWSTMLSHPPSRIQISQVHLPPSIPTTYSSSFYFVLAIADWGGCLHRCSKTEGEVDHLLPCRTPCSQPRYPDWRREKMNENPRPSLGPLPTCR